LEMPNNAVVIDPKGECYAVTHQYRRDVLGHQIVVLDPFCSVTEDGDSLNPLDLFAWDKAEDTLDKALMMVEVIRGGLPPDLKDPFWDKQAALLLAALIWHIAEREPAERRNLTSLASYLTAEDFTLKVATWLDQNVFPKESRAYGILAQYLNLPERETRPSVLATAVSNCSPLMSESCGKLLKPTSFDLEGFRRGDVSMTIYIVIPPQKLASASGILRILLSTFLSAITSRTQAPTRKTLMLVDEVAALGSMPELACAVTLLRGYGVVVHLFLQDLQQLKMLYPSAWQTVFSNCCVVQIFGIRTHIAALELANVLGVDVSKVLNMGPTEQMIVTGGNNIVVAKKLDYLTDRHFEGRWSPNPMYAGIAATNIGNTAKAKARQIRLHTITTLRI